ncbi:MAG: hypothetical protein K0B02_03235 [DPANN group archaeon]|nr:hypothetical protein [DPANN group archaeon]
MSRVVDFYEITMSNGYFQENMHEDTVTFDLFVRNLPKNRGYLVSAGLEQALSYLENMTFCEDAIEQLKDLPNYDFKDDFLDYLEKFEFKGDVYAIGEGNLVFGQEPILRITAPRIDAQLVESYLLTTINHQTMIASKTSRIVQTADNKVVVDFGLRRAHGPYSSVLGSRVAYIADVKQHQTCLQQVNSAYHSLELWHIHG